MIKKSIPSLITCLNLVCGLLAILSEDMRMGVFLILIGGLFDVFDGLVARLLNVTTEIGAQLDSLADIVSFGVAPAILFYRSFDGDGSIVSLLAPIFIVSAGALRLARFNTQTEDTDYFRGLAIPSSGLFLCGLVLSKYYGDGLSEIISNNFLITTGIATILAFLNISNIKMFSLKQLSKSNLVKMYFGLLLIGIILFLIFAPYSAIALAILLYVLLATLDHYIFNSEARILSQN